MIFDFINFNFFPQNNLGGVSGKSCSKFDNACDKSEGIPNFSEKLAKLLNADNNDFKCVDADCAENKTVPQSDTDFEKILDSLAGNLQSSKGNDFLNQLKLFLVLSGHQSVLADGKSGMISLDGKAIQALEKLLVNAGFNMDEINSLMTKLKSKSDNGSMCLSDLLKGLSKLKTGRSDSEKKDKSEALIAISALPFIESTMKSLGIPDDLSDKIISDSKEEGKGINLDVLIKGLKKLNKQSFYSGTSFEIDRENKSFDRMLAQMGFLNQGRELSGKTDSRKFTLGDFLTGLENMRNKGKTDGFPALQKEQKITQQSENTDDLLDDFMTGLKRGNADKISMTDKNKMKKKILSHFKAKTNGILKGQKETYPLRFDKKIGPVKAAAGDNSLDPELAKLMGKVAGFINAGGSDHNVSDGAKKNAEVLFDKTDKKSITKISGQENSAGGSLGESRLTSKSFGTVRFGSSGRTLPSYVTSQVARGLVRAVSRGSNELRLQLKPPELGRLIVKIDNLGDSLKVSIVTENHVAKDILASHESSLKAVLAGSGISIETFDVSMGGSFSQSMADAGNNAGSGTGGSGTGKNKQAESVADVADEVISHGISTVSPMNDSALHFVA